MFHYPETRHIEPGLQIFQRAAVALKEEIQEKTPRRVGKRLENEIVIRHGLDSR